MRFYIFIFFGCLNYTGFAQTNSFRPNNTYNKVFESRYVQQPPVFTMGADSAGSYYFKHFPAADSILLKAVAYGDTAKYLRIYFSFVVDKYGFITEPHFIRIASTRYAKSLYAKTLLYFLDDEMYYEKAIKQMLRKMNGWKPAMQNGTAVACRIEEYFQFWIGINQPL